jgi:hypothetical protein
MFALIENGAVKQYPYGLVDIKLANPNTSFPVTVSDATMAEYGAMRVYFSTQPVLSDTQLSEEDTPVFDVDAQRWAQGWRVREMTAEEIVERNTVREAELLQRNTTQANVVRTTRNEKLAASDWTQLSDSPADKSVWAAYRQSLRDVPSQAGFPWTITWPEQPA